VAETHDDRAEAAAAAALQAGAYPFETCSECMPKVTELLKLVFLEASSTFSAEGASPECMAARIEIHRWLAAHQQERGHVADRQKHSQGREPPY
jgi:hypothetical protein